MKIRQNLVKITTLNCILIMEINRIFTRKKLSVISQYFSGTPAARILPFFYVFFYSVVHFSLTTLKTDDIVTTQSYVPI